MAVKNTKVTYMYRCASNWKYWGSFTVKGTLTHADLEPHLFDGEFFVPEQVDLNHLLTDPWTKDDHILHTLLSFDETDEKECICTAKQMVKKFKDADRKDWFEGYSPFDLVSKNG
jgi:hypothetical protein